MTITESLVVSPLSAKGTEISAASFGMNFVLGYERFGTKPWEKFDEIQSSVGSHQIRFPGGAEAEVLFDYGNINATSAVRADGTVVQLTTPDAFLAYCAQTNSQATINLPVFQLLGSGKYGTRDFDPAKADEVRAYVAHVLETAGPGGIANFELGNEYPAYMNAVEYGKVASTLAVIVQQEITRYYSTRPGDQDDRPGIAVQVTGQSPQGSFSLEDLAQINRNVMAQFDASELSAITAVTSHFYYWEGINAGKANSHSYDNISGAIGYSLQMMNAWSSLTGRSLDTVFSEWNVNFRDSANYGLQQVPVLLEMFSTFVAGGVDELDFWSTMYNATSLGTYSGSLMAAGALFQIMSEDLIGTRVTEVPVASDNYDIHAFSGKGQAVMFISSLVDQAMTVKLDISAYLDRYDLTSARLMQVDLSAADGVYKSQTGLAPWEEADAPVRLTMQDILAMLKAGLLSEYLGAHETLVLEFSTANTTWGSNAIDRLTGLSANDRIDALGSDDLLSGMAGNDTLFGGFGNDTIRGGYGEDRIWGGLGSDVIYGGRDNDTIEGKANNDFIRGGYGDDFIAGGDCSDTLWGDQGADAFIFRSGDVGLDVIRDFSTVEGDFLVFDGLGPVSRADFQVEYRALRGVGAEGSVDMLVRLGADGPLLWALADVGQGSGVMLMDADTGTLFALN